MTWQQRRRWRLRKNILISRCVEEEEEEEEEEEKKKEEDDTKGARAWTLNPKP